MGKVDRLGNIYIADRLNYRVRKVDAITGIIYTIAGNGIDSSMGDGGLAKMATLKSPSDLAIDTSGIVYVLEGSRVRKIDTLRIITTIAGTGTGGFSGDSGLAINAQIGGKHGYLYDFKYCRYSATSGEIGAGE